MGLFLDLFTEKLSDFYKTYAPIKSFTEGVAGAAAPVAGNTPRDPLALRAAVEVGAVQDAHNIRQGPEAVQGDRHNIPPTPSRCRTRSLHVKLAARLYGASVTPFHGTYGSPVGRSVFYLSPNKWLRGYGIKNVHTSFPLCGRVFRTCVALSNLSLIHI